MSGDDPQARWVALAKAEVTRREAATLDIGGVGPRERFLGELAEIRSRLLAGRPVEEVVPDQVALGRRVDRWLNDWLKERRGGG